MREEKLDLSWLKAQLAFSELDFANALDFAKKAIEVEPNDSLRTNLAARAALFDFRIDEAEQYLRAFGARTRPHGAMQGARSNPLESFTRELLTELRLDRGALARTLKARESVGERGNVWTRSRPASLTSAITRPPRWPCSSSCDAKISSQAWTKPDEFRRSGKSRAASCSSGTTKFWRQTSNKYAKSWTINNIDCDYRRFSSRTAREYLQSRFARPVIEAFMRANEAARKADIFRLAFLYAEGGYYADVDDRCVAPIEIIDPGGRDLLLHQEEIGSIGNNFIGAIPRHPVIGAALAQAVEAVNGGGRETPWLATGPGMLTRVLAASIAADVRNFLDASNAPLILEREDLRRAVSIHCMASYKTSSNHWSRNGAARIRSRYADELDALCALAGVAIEEDQNSDAKIFRICSARPPSFAVSWQGPWAIGATGPVIGVRDVRRSHQPRNRANRSKASTWSTQAASEATLRVAHLRCAPATLLFCALLLGLRANILAKRIRKDTFAFSSRVYRQRNLFEHCLNNINKLRDDDVPLTFLAAVKLAAARANLA